jgi:hypothetical protein
MSYVGGVDLEALGTVAKKLLEDPTKYNFHLPETGPEWASDYLIRGLEGIGEAFGVPGVGNFFAEYKINSSRWSDVSKSLEKAGAPREIITNIAELGTVLIEARDNQDNQFRNLKGYQT